MSVIAPITNGQTEPDVQLSKVVSADGTEHTTSTDHTKKTDVSAETFSSNGSKVTYNDPHADVSLVSIEGRVFKVQSYVLKAQSTFFLDKLGEGTYQGDPIPILAPTRVLKAWLDLAHLYNRPSRWVWHLNDPLFKLCDHLGSRGVAERALLLMHSEAERDPWALFVLASQKKNVGLAKSALRSLEYLQKTGAADKAITIGSLTPALAEGVTLPYLLGLYAAALKVKAKEKATNGYGNGHGFAFGGWAPGSAPASPPGSPNGSLKCDTDDVDIGWKAIADVFQPVSG